MHQRPSKSSAKPELGARMLGAGHRMAGHEMHARGHVAADLGDRLLLDRANVREDGAGGERRCDRLRDCRIGAERRAQHDEVGLGHSLLGPLVDGIDDAECECRPAAALALGAADDLPGEPVAPHPPRERGADEADADECYAREERLRRHR